MGITLSEKMDDIVLKSETTEPEDLTTLENDREKECELEDNGNEQIKENILAILQSRETARFDDLLIECDQSDLLAGLDELTKSNRIKCIDGLYMLNDLDQAAESDQDDLLSGKMVVTISRKQFYELEANERVLISIEGNEDDPETVLERLRYEQRMRRMTGFHPYYQQQGQF